MRWFRKDTDGPDQSPERTSGVRLVMYGRRFGCYDQERARSWLEARGIQYEFLDISSDSEALRRLELWVGHRSVPTLVVARPGEVEPYEPPAALQPGQRVRGTNRGTLITEPSNDDLERWLAQHGLL